MRKDVYDCDLCRQDSRIQGIRTTLHFSTRVDTVDLCSTHRIVIKQILDWLGVKYRVENNVPVGNVDVYIELDQEAEHE